MTDRSRALLILAGAVFTAFCVSQLLAPWADVVAVVLVIGIAITSTAFSTTYLLTRPWWTTTIGKGMLFSSLSLALLSTISLIYQALGDNYAVRDAVRLTVFELILAGTLFKLFAFFAPTRFRPRWWKGRDRG